MVVCVRAGTRMILIKSVAFLKGDWVKEERILSKKGWLSWAQARNDREIVCYTKVRAHDVQLDD